MSHNDTTLWQANRAFYSRSWADGAVLYDAASGDTHHLTLLALQILRLLQNDPYTLPALSARVLAAEANTPNQDTIEAIVLNLNALRLIEPILL